MTKKNLKEPSKMTFEQATDELDSIIKQMDSGEDDLETMMKSHARGQILIKRCKELLGAAEQQLQTVEVDEIES